MEHWTSYLMDLRSLCTPTNYCWTIGDGANYSVFDDEVDLGRKIGS
jgi:hypothetical protein